MSGVDILFVVPATKPRMKEESMGTLILAKKAELSGFKIKIARYWEVSSSPKSDYKRFRVEFTNYILSYHPKVVSFYCRCEEYHICIDLSGLIKSLAPSVRIAFGGPQAELVAKQTIAYFPFVDYVCCSEGENTIVPFLKMLCDETWIGTASDVEGLTYRDTAGNVFQNRFPDFLPDNYIRSFNYYDLIPKDVLNACEGLPIDVGRGCPFSCTYCSTKSFWKRKFRLRNLTDTIDEMEYVSKHFGVISFDFMHDLFTVRKDRVVQFCSELKRRNLDITWGCDSRIGTIDFETIDLMVETGLRQIFFGIETGSERMQAIINKRLDLNKCDEIVRYCLNKGLKVTTSFIYGFPEETEYDLNKTLKMAVRFQNYGCNVLTNMCHIMNGTELYGKYSDELFISKDVAYNRCIPAFGYLFDLIASHKDMFANFCDFRGGFREEMKYIDVFRYSLNFANENMPEEHAVLVEKDYASINMYRSFCLANAELFATTVESSDGDISNIRKKLKGTSRDTYAQLILNLVSSIN